MGRLLRIGAAAFAFTFLLHIFLSPPLFAFSASESRVFKEGPYSFRMEVQFRARGSLKKKTCRLTSVKVKIKNDQGSSAALKVRSVRAFSDAKVYGDIETLGFSVVPGNWVTKFYRLKKHKQPLIYEDGYVEVAFDNFRILFLPWERRLQGPIR